MNTNSNPLRSSLGYVLIVDDEEQNRILLRDPLEAQGYEIAEAADGIEAHQMILLRPPDVILLDVMMPNLHGFGLCERLKDDPRTASIPVLMVTALSERKERLMGIKIGATDFLTKPVDMQEVLLRVGNAARSKQLHDQLQIERARSERLLENMLPVPVANRLKHGETTIADHFPEVTVLFADLVNFTSLAAMIGPEQVVYLLNELFSAFDELAARRNLEKIKTVGDGYLLVGGVPLAREDHARAVVELALDFRKAIARFNLEYQASIQFRIGICSGPVVAGVIGRKRLAYDVWGDTVNRAFRLGANGAAGSIQIAASTRELLPEEYLFEELEGGAGCSLLQPLRDVDSSAKSMVCEPSLAS